MSNGEAKRWEIKATKWDNPKAEWRFHDSEGPGFPGYDSPPPCIKVMRVEDHERIVAELKAEYEQLQAVVTAPQMQYEEEIAELRAEIVRQRRAMTTGDRNWYQLNQTIAAQKRVIEKLTSAISDVLHERYSDDDTLAAPSDPLIILLNEIEKGEA